jgi:hypothetical protein
MMMMMMMSGSVKTKWIRDEREVNDIVGFKFNYKLYVS